MHKYDYKRTKFTCFYTYLAMSSVFCLPSMLFLTFRETYGISFTLLGTLVLVNFCTQFTIDVIFSFFSKHFNIKWTVRMMPLLTALGLILYALIPTLFPKAAYIGLLTGTVIFSVAAGLCEVLLSPLIAALPSEHPERDMSMLHSLYAYGVLFMVLFSTVYLTVFGKENWNYLPMILACFPIVSCVLFCISPIPDLNLGHEESAQAQPTTNNRRKGLLLCVLCIFLGSCAENAMTNWISTFLESALGITKAVGDILGLALFAVLLGIARTLYAKFGKNILRVLLAGMIGASVCYIGAALSPIPLLAMLACVLTGFCTAMLWPGTLILMEEKYPSPGIAAYALMAAGGDLGGSIAPQLLGIIIDTVSVTPFAAGIGQSLGLTAEQIGMKAGMLVGAVFPILGTVLLLYMKHRFFRRSAAE